VTELPLPEGYRPPLLPREIQEGAAVARRDEGVRGAQEAEGLDPDTASANGLLTGTPYEPEHACATHRCLRLFFFDDAHVVPTFSVIVDISALTVVEVSPMATGQGDG
jgi:hypothetical protein